MGYLNERFGWGFSLKVLEGDLNRIFLVGRFESNRFE
jgi:hypothetical protein